MIKKAIACSPVENLFVQGSRPEGSARQRQLKLISYAAFAIFSLLLIAPQAAAETKTRNARGKREERPRRVADKRTAKVVNNRAAQVENKKLARVENKKPAKVKEISKRVPVTRYAPPPAIRKTVIVAPVQANNNRAARPSLVNDIVIISEAPVSSHLPNASAPNITSERNMPSIWPVAGAIRGGFGVRRNPFGGSSSEFHKGQDISAPMGTPVIATADGVITIAGWQRGYGQVVYIDHGNGLTTRYGHLSRIDVMVGQTVQRGSHLGLVGSTGRSTGPHLHYEVRRDGQPLNPLPYLPYIPAPAIPVLQ